MKKASKKNKISLENNTAKQSSNNAANKPETKTIRYDGMIKDIVWRLDNENVISLINEIYNSDIAFDSKVEFLGTETQNNENERDADFHIKIGERLFHIEVQTNEDGSMALRIFEYGFRAALMFGKAEEGYDYVKMTIPEPAVVFLRKGKNKFHKKFKIILELPGENNVAQYECKAIYINDFSLETIFEKRLFPFVPFYFMRYENMLERKHTDEEEQEMLNQLKKAGELLNKAVIDKTISVDMAAYIKEYVLKIFGHTVEKAENINNKEEVNNAMIDLNETVTITDWFATIEKAEMRAEMRGKTEGKIEGETIGETKGAKGLASAFKKIGRSKEETIFMIVNEIGLSEDTAKECVEEVWSK